MTLWLFKIVTQGVSMWYVHVYMYYIPIWFASSIFLLSTLVRDIFKIFLQTEIYTYISHMFWIHSFMYFMILKINYTIDKNLWFLGYTMEMPDTTHTW
jgi:hypothetical protein